MTFIKKRTKVVWGGAKKFQKLISPAKLFNKVVVLPPPQPRRVNCLSLIFDLKKAKLYHTSFLGYSWMEGKYFVIHPKILNIFKR